MKRIIHVVALLVMALSVFAIVPGGVMAQQAGRETVSIQVDVTLPSGSSVIGTLVARRECGATTATNLTFNGMIDGKPASATATATEEWSGDGRGEISNLKLVSWNSTLPKPVALDLSIVQTTSGLVTVNGVPAAIDGDMKAPCGGRTSYTLTGAGQGAAEITMLPKTGEGFSFTDPLVIVAILTVPGVCLVFLSHLLGKLAQRSGSSR